VRLPNGVKGALETEGTELQRKRNPPNEDPQDQVNGKRGLVLFFILGEIVRWGAFGPTKSVPRRGFLEKKKSVLGGRGARLSRVEFRTVTCGGIVNRLGRHIG